MKQCKKTNEKIKAKPSTDAKSIEGFFYTYQKWSDICMILAPF